MRSVAVGWLGTVICFYAVPVVSRDGVCVFSCGVFPHRTHIMTVFFIIAHHFNLFQFEITYVCVTIPKFL